MRKSNKRAHNDMADLGVLFDGDELPEDDTPEPAAPTPEAVTASALRPAVRTPEPKALEVIHPHQYRLIGDLDDFVLLSVILHPTVLLILPKTLA